MNLLAILTLLGTASITNAVNSYMVVVPQNIKPNTTLTVPFHFLSPAATQTVTAKLVDRSIDDLVFSQVSTSGNGVTELTLELPIPHNVSWGSYRVNVSGEGSVVFRNSTYVYGSPRSKAILIQTDKAMYKPGETVQYRVFAINSSLQLPPASLDIEFFDPKGNKIKESMGQDNLMSGGIQGELRLSDMPPLGSWRIAAEIAGADNTREDYRFQVKEYVLPKFEVTVSLPPFGQQSDVSLTGTAKAMYTFGKPVSGTLILTVKKRYSSGFHDPRAIRTEMQIDGEATFEIPMNVLERLSRNMEYETLVVIANVTEAITGITLIGQGEIRYYRNPYRLEFFPNMPENFKPDMGPYKVKLRVMQQDDRPPANTAGEQVTITNTFFTEAPVTSPPLSDEISLLNYDVISPFINGETIMKQSQTYNLQPDGTVEFDINIPPKTSSFAIKAKYRDITQYKDVKRFRSPGENYIKVKIMNTNPLKIGDTLQIDIESQTTVTSLPNDGYYAILSKGAIVTNGKISSAGNLMVPVTKEMAPSARLVIYFILPDGEIVADGLNFVVENIFENSVTIQFNETASVEPQTPVSLTVRADPGSLVNVLAVDKSVLLLADGNDITPQRVKDVLGRLGDTPWILRGWGHVLPWSFGADDAADIFDNAKLKVMTDANLYSFNIWELSQPESYSSNSFGGGVAMRSSAMVSADAGGSGGSAQGTIRQEFPETWIWRSAVASNTGEARFEDVAPDTITEFVANAFAIHPDSGLGVAPTTSNLTVFLPFFVNLQLPYAVVRSEVVVIQANVFNYKDADQYASVRLKASPDYSILSIASDGTETEITEDYTQCILAKKDTATPAFFNIRPNKVGSLTLNVRATIRTPATLFDEVIRTLPVKAEGITKEKNQAILVSMQTAGTFTETKDITYPATGLVPDSEKIRVTVFGDLFGQSLENLGDLIRMPYGCGEQNMVNFAPSVFAAVYLRNTARLNSNQELKNKIQNTLNTGIQRQLLYQRNDGSYSAFGDADESGNLWLTAFVVKSFAQASALDFIFIDSGVIEKSVRYLIENQHIDGSFVPTGFLGQKSLTGDSATTNRTLAAYTLIALQMAKLSETIRDPDVSLQLNDAITNARSYLISGIPEMTSVYEMAIAMYALQLDRPQCTECETLMQKLDQHPAKTTSGNEMYWNDDSTAVRIEQNAYILLALTLREDQNNGVKLLNWLVKQRNPRGGFYSTQDTVIALQALSEFATLIYSAVVDMAVTITTISNGVSGTPAIINLNSDNHDVFQYRDFDGSVDQITVSVSGTGLVLVDINQYYNVKTEDTPESYILEVTTSEETDTSYKLSVCATFNIPASRSNMAIIDIGVISGFEPEKDAVSSTIPVKRTELTSGRLILYYDEIPSERTCVDVPVQRVAVVAGVKPANVVVYSYYEPTERAMREYLPANMQTSTVCGTCPSCCNQGNTVSLIQCGIF